MAKLNPFSISQYNLGSEVDIGVDSETVSNSLTDMGYSQAHTCYVCTAPAPAYRVLAKEPAHETAQIQNGLYICKHCLSQGILDPSIYGVRGI